jgi:hypothetical protein
MSHYPFEIVVNYQRTQIPTFQDRMIFHIRMIDSQSANLAEPFEHMGNIVDSIKRNSKTSALPEFPLCPKKSLHDNQLLNRVT